MAFSRWASGKGMANFKFPRYVWFVDDFPITQSGEVLKFKLREMAVEKFDLGEN